MTAPELVAQVKNLPPVSYAALKLVNLLDEPDVGNDEVVQVLKCDNVLTAKLLRACNSPYFGLTEPILSVDQAVLLLGHQQILHIVLSLSFGSAMGGPLPGYAMEADELWMHSFITAMAAEAVAAEFPELKVEPAVAFTIGLLHDIGKVVMAQTVTADQHAEIRQRAQDQQIPGYGAEMAVLGTDHTEVGACLLQSWGLPEEIVEAVAHHHHPVLQPVPLMSAVTYMADCIAHLAGPTPRFDGYAFRVDNEVAARLHLTGDRLEKLVLTTRDAFDRMDLFMSLG